MKIIFSTLFLFFTLLGANLSAQIPVHTAASDPLSHYREKIQPIFDNRCIACHSCLNAPCQLNLQNFDNFSRGAHHLNAYDGLRLESVLPTRPGVDAKTNVDWAKLGFFTVNQTPNLDENIFYQHIGIKELSLRDIPGKTVEESNSCIDNAGQLKTIFKMTTDLQMPYAMTPISTEERIQIGKWIAAGAPGPKKKMAPSSHAKHIKEWDQFFNRNTKKNQLVSRYLYEHLYLAHIYFPENPTEFYRLVRSSTKCSDKITELPTRRANDYPGTDSFYYCLDYQDLTIVAKTHMPFEFNSKVLNRFEELFLKENWKVTSTDNVKDSYSYKYSENPFITFQDIPVKARYQFLLDHSQYTISTFIKGPVCNGSKAVNSIQEQFYVFFIDPKTDFSVQSEIFTHISKNLLVLPGLWGSDIKLNQVKDLAEVIVEHREGYRKLRADESVRVRPDGHKLTDLWDGNGENDNAVLTIMRHDDNAVVLKGFHGDLPKTLFVLDYALFERLVYNLVVNFDVFGNVSHQLLTRAYMDLIRMEAEENFLAFLPPSARLPLRKSWYKGFITEKKMKYFFPLITKDQPINIEYQNTTNAQAAKLEFVEKMFYGYLNEKVRGPIDHLNWKAIPIKTAANPLSSIETELKKIVSSKAIKTNRFPNYFPENGYLIVETANGHEVFTIAKHREHENVSWILAESLRLAPSEDSISLLKGFSSFYPNLFFYVKEQELQTFTKDTLKLRNPLQYKEFKKKYAVSRVSPEFWNVYDLLNRKFKEENPTEFGYLDLTRYAME